jgi:hypothetical protein
MKLLPQFLLQNLELEWGNAGGAPVIRNEIIHPDDSTLVVTSGGDIRCAATIASCSRYGLLGER